jgi:hypothetical protein
VKFTAREDRQKKKSLVISLDSESQNGGLNNNIHPSRLRYVHPMKFPFDYYYEQSRNLKKKKTTLLSNPKLDYLLKFKRK